MGMCPLHGAQSPFSYTTVFSTGATKTNSGTLALANLTTTGISSCGHPSIAISGSQLTTVEQTSLHRIGDLGTNAGQYVAINGSPNVTSA